MSTRFSSEPESATNYIKKKRGALLPSSRLSLLLSKANTKAPLNSQNNSSYKTPKKKKKKKKGVSSASATFWTSTANHYLVSFSLLAAISPLESHWKFAGFLLLEGKPIERERERQALTTRNRMKPKYFLPQMSATCKARAALSFSSSFISLEEVELLESHDSLLFVGLWTFYFYFFYLFPLCVLSILIIIILSASGAAGRRHVSGVQGWRLWQLPGRGSHT